MQKIIYFKVITRNIISFKIYFSKIDGNCINPNKFLNVPFLR